MTRSPYDPMSDGALQDQFVDKWRDAAYGCFSSGHKFCREVCPVMQVTRNENHTPTAFHANIVAMEKGLVEVADVADDYVHCTQCGACERPAWPLISVSGGRAPGGCARTYHAPRAWR